jgi:hypothetical protein
MQSSISWIDWLDRLDRVIGGVRHDLKVLKRLATPETLATVELGKRQLAALTDELRRLDRSVLASPSSQGHGDRADNLRRALDTTVFQLGKLGSAAITAPFAARERLLSTVDAALRDSVREADSLLKGPEKRLA